MCYLTMLSRGANAWQGTYIAAAMCIHFAGYELARAASITLFASKEIGLGLYPSALPFVTAAVLPVSIGALALYGRCVQAFGPRTTLQLSVAVSSMFFLAVSAFLSAGMSDTVMTRSVVAALYMFREIYVNLMGTQLWGLLNTALREQSAASARGRLCAIQGLSCVCSAIAGVAAGWMSRSGGPLALLIAAGACLIGVLVAVSADSKGFASSIEIFQESPLLTALLMEAIVHQVLTAALSMGFHEAVRGSLEHPEFKRAATGFVGNSFAIIGLISGALQLVIMPWLMMRVDPSHLLQALPLLMGISFLGAFVLPGVRSASAMFGTTKVLEYSVRSTALELIYVAMPESDNHCHHQKDLGKEAIGLVGIRLGRTGAYLGLYLVSIFWGAPSLRFLTLVALASTLMWGMVLARVRALTPPLVTQFRTRGGEGAGAALTKKKAL